MLLAKVNFMNTTCSAYSASAPKCHISSAFFKKVLSVKQIRRFLQKHSTAWRGVQYVIYLTSLPISGNSNGISQYKHQKVIKRRGEKSLKII